MSFFTELKRRNVFKVGIAYVLMGWLVLQGVDFGLDLIDAPNWVIQAFSMLVIAGLPLALFFAWAFELTPEGIKREHEVDRTQSITNQTGRKLDFMIIGVLVLAVAYLLFDKFGGEGDEPAAVAQEAPAGITETPANLLPSPDDLSIAVLPFEHRSAQEEDLYFTDGIHDDLLTQLAKFDDMKVISRTSVMVYRGSGKQIPEIAAELGVSKILEGGVQRAGNRIRINAQLIDVTTDEHLWAETFDREMTVENIFDIQSEITRQIVSAIRGELSPEEAEALDLPPTANLAAYEAFQRGNAHLNEPEYNISKFQAGERWFQQAVDMDPEFAEAWAMLVVTHGQAFWMGYDASAERAAAAKAALEAAERLNPESPMVIAVRGDYLYRIKSDFRGAEPYFAEAARLLPGEPELLNTLAIAERRIGKFDDAVRHLRMAIDLAPTAAWYKANLLGTLVQLRQYDEAERLANQWMDQHPDVAPFAVELANIMVFKYHDLEKARDIMDAIEPFAGPLYAYSNAYLYVYERDYEGLIKHWQQPAMLQFRSNSAVEVFVQELLGMAHHQLGQEEKAREHWDRVHELLASATTRTSQSFGLWAAAYAHGLAGDTQKALEFARQSMEFTPENEDSYEGPNAAFPYAWALGLNGQRDEALAEISRLLESPIGLNTADLKFSPYWDYFRDDPRFVALYEGGADGP